jgi:hypothetical protein
MAGSTQSNYRISHYFYIMYECDGCMSIVCLKHERWHHLLNEKGITNLSSSTRSSSSFATACPLQTPSRPLCLFSNSLSIILIVTDGRALLITGTSLSAVPQFFHYCYWIIACPLLMTSDIGTGPVLPVGTNWWSLITRQQILSISSGKLRSKLCRLHGQ